MNLRPTETENYQSSAMISNDRNEMAKFNRQYIIQRRKPTCFEWIQLLAIISIPIIIILYLIIQKPYSSSIDSGNRHQDIDVGNKSRISDQEIGIAEKDQHNQNILNEYQMFLAKLIIDYGTNFSGKPETKIAAQFMTTATLKQLNAKNKAILLRSLYDPKLITLRPSDNPFAVSTIDLRQADLTNTVFGLSTDVQGEISRTRYIVWHYLWLPFTILRNASFRYTSLDCASFEYAIMDSADLSYIYHFNPQCVTPIREGQTNFVGASLVGTSFYKANIRFASFDHANLSFANMYDFHCIHCTFSSAILYKTNLTYSFIFYALYAVQERVNFRHVNFSHAILHSSRYRSINFDQSDWSNAQATEIFIYNSTFNNAMLNNCSFAKSFITLSIFENANLRSVDFNNATLRNVTWINSDMTYANLSSLKCEYCLFNNVTFHGAVLKNASFQNSSFLDCYIDISQLSEAADFPGSILPNGTLVSY